MNASCQQPTSPHIPAESAVHRTHQSCNPTSPSGDKPNSDHQRASDAGISEDSSTTPADVPSTEMPSSDTNPSSSAEAHPACPSISSAASTVTAETDPIVSVENGKSETTAHNDLRQEISVGDVNTASPESEQVPIQHMEGIESAKPALPEPTPQPSIDHPCMRGALRLVSGLPFLSGMWGMTIGSHDAEGETSAFELKMVHEDGRLEPYPMPSSGVYHGFFMLKQTAGRPPIKVDEKQVCLEFTLNSAGGHNVTGTGKNRFGTFKIFGRRELDGTTELFRTYDPKPTKGGDNRKRGRAGRPGGSGKRKRSTSISPDPQCKNLQTAAASAQAQGHPLIGGKSLKGLSIYKPDVKEEKAATSVTAPATPAQSPAPVGRSQRTSRGDWKDKADIPKKAPTSSTPAEPKSKPGTKGTPGTKGKRPSGKGKMVSPQPSAVSAADEVTYSSVSTTPGMAAGTHSKAGRMRRIPSYLQDNDDLGTDGKVRLNEHMRKCLQVIRYMRSQPNAHWFNDPVDPIALGIPEYSNVVKNPMDLGTVKNNIESGKMTKVDDFKAAVLLVFKNALTFNKERDNAVNIAARGLQTVFESRCRTQVDNLGKETGEESGRGRKKGSGQTKGRAKPGPRPANGDTGKASVHKGGAVSQMHEMQKQMRKMQETISMLQKQTTQTEVKMQAQRTIQTPGSSRKSSVDDHRPMSHQDKVTLSSSISSLPNDKLSRVVEIVKERMPLLKNEGDNEIEIDINALDVPTLRHLQRYVKSCNARKRKLAPTKQQIPSPGLLPDLDMTMDINDLAADALGTSKRSSFEADIMDLPLSQGDGVTFPTIETSSESEGE